MLMFRRYGGSIMNWRVCASSLPMVVVLTSCISIPLGSGGPELEKISLPATGDQAAEVRQAFGEPQRLDTPTHWVYEWSTDRKFVIVPVTPMGMPVGAPVVGNRYRMLVEFGLDGRVVRVECTARDVPDDAQTRLDCETPVEPLRAGARALFGYRLDGRPGFEDIAFSQTEGGGASTSIVLSSDGRLLAATDGKNRLWIIDTESGKAIHRHDGEPIRFFSLAPPGQVKAAFSNDGVRLIVTQRKIGTTRLERRPDGDFEPIEDFGRTDLQQVVFGGDADVILAIGEGGVVTLRPQRSGSTPIDRMARLDFEVNGPGQVEPALRSDGLIAVRLGQTWWTGGRTAVFTPEGRGVAVLDLRNDYARVGKQGYGFSMDGTLFAHNTGRHLELWSSAELLAVAEGTSAAAAASPAWVALMPYTNRKDEEETSHMPVAFRPDGRFVAAASRAAIHVWRAGDGAPVAIVGALKEVPDPTTGESSIGLADADDSYGVLRVLAIALADDNRLTVVFADSRLEILIGAWQIEEWSSQPTGFPAVDPAFQP